MRQRIEVLADYAGLGKLMSFADAAEQSLTLSEEQRYLMRLVIEEIATNIIKYSYPSGAPGPICVDCAAAGGVLEVQIRDCGAPFDPHDAPSPDLSADLAQRPIGGLGLFLVRELSDELHYQHDPATRWNELTIVKRAEARHA